MGCDVFQCGAGKAFRQIAVDSFAEEQRQSLFSNKQVLTTGTYTDLRCHQYTFEISGG
jgi:hypothetical protein